MITDKWPAAGELGTGVGSQVSDGGAAGARQDDMTNARQLAATSAVRLAMVACTAAMHFGTYCGKDTQMQETCAFTHQAQDPIQLGYLVQMPVNLPANLHGAVVDPDPTEGGSLDSQMDNQGNTSPHMSLRQELEQLLNPAFTHKSKTYLLLGMTPEEVRIYARRVWAWRL
jgi:hypothetical protein